MRFCLELVLATAVFGTLTAASLPASEATHNAAAASAPRAVWVVKVDARTGKLVRALVTSGPPNGKTASAFRSLAAEAAKSFDVNPMLVDSVIQVESNYNPFAVSPKGAEGLMQLMPSTAQRFGVTDSFDPKQNIEAGVHYLKLLEDAFQDDRLALAAYNAGENAVARYKDVPPYPETVSYVAKVAQKYGQAKRAAANSNYVKREAKAAGEPGSTGETTRHIFAYVDSQGKLHLATQ